MVEPSRAIRGAKCLRLDQRSHGDEKVSTYYSSALVGQNSAVA